MYRQKPTQRRLHRAAVLSLCEHGQHCRVPVVAVDDVGPKSKVRYRVEHGACEESVLLALGLAAAIDLVAEVKLAVNKIDAHAVKLKALYAAVLSAPAEVYIKIEHVLLGLPEAELSDIDQVYSHPQALMQCSKILEEHRDWEKISLKNTAVSAKKVKEDGKKNQAAIASKLTAELYGLKILKENLSNNADNYTRFIIVTGKHVFEKDAKKVSICFEIPHQSGSLYQMISHFIFNGINMTKIESRPIQGKNWEYRFFIDIEGNLNDGAVQNALNGLSEETSKLKILGNY